MISLQWLTYGAVNVGTDRLDARKRALRLLARREHSRLELSRKLDAKGVNSNKIEGLLDHLERQGLLSDERFTESYVHSRKQRGYGPYRIAAELKDKGIAESLIEKYLNPDASDWGDLASYHYRKRYGGKAIMSRQERARRARFLLARGFSNEMIFKLLDDID